MSAREPAIDFQAEARLLLLCARFAFEPADERRVRGLIESGIDWDRLIGMAQRHGLVPVLYWRLIELDPSPVSKAVFVRLLAMALSGARRARAMSAELLELLRRFEENDIPALPFKGPVLADLLYGDASLREYGDLDILIHVRDVLRARDLIEAAGYEPEYPLSPRREHLPIEDPMHHAFAHRHRDTGIVVELHWSTDCRLLALPGIDDCWWEGRPRAEFQGRPVRALMPEELLYVLCMHGTTHRWGSLGLIRDLAGAIGRHPGVDWRRVLDLAEGQGTGQLVLLGVELAQRLLAARLPEEVASRIAADPGVSVVAKGIIRRLGVVVGPAPTIGEKLAFVVACTRCWPRWPGHVARRTLLPNMADWSRWDLPPALSLLYYPLHIVRLASKFGKSAE